MKKRIVHVEDTEMTVSAQLQPTSPKPASPHPTPPVDADAPGSSAAHAASAAPPSAEKPSLPISNVQVVAGTGREAAGSIADMMRERDLEYMFEEAPKIRLIVIGDSSAGKTALLQRFYEGQFNEGCAPTLAVDVTTANLELGRQKVGVQLFDTAGQERFAPLTAPYYRQADGVLVAYDIGSRKSFERALGYWAEQLDRYGSERLVAALVGTKADLAEDMASYREVGAAEAERAAAEAKWLSCPETSARSGTGVTDAFALLCCTIMNERNEKGIPDQGAFQDGMLGLHRQDSVRSKGCCGMLRALDDLGGMGGMGAF